MVDHIHELISIALTPDKSRKTLRAFMLLSNLKNNELMKAALNDDFLDIIADCLLRNKAAPEYVIGRLSTITLVACMCFPNDYIKSTSYLTILLKYAHNSSVFFFFKKLFSEDPRMRIIQDWMVSTRFSGYISDLIIFFDINHYCDESTSYSDDFFQLLSSLYMIISFGASNQVTLPSFQTDEIIHALTKVFTYEPAYIKGSRWKAICSLCSPKFIGTMNQFIPIALSLLIEQTKNINLYQVQCINFLLLALKLDENNGKILRDLDIFQILIGLVIKHHESSILTNSFRAFVVCSMKNNDICKDILLLYVPFLMHEAVNKEYGLLSSICWFLLAKATNESRFNKKIRETLKLIPGFSEFKETKLLRYLNIIERQYGGPVPIETYTAFATPASPSIF